MAKKREISVAAKADNPPKQDVTKQLTEEASQAEQPALPLYKDDSNVFNIPVEDEKDYISRLPSEILDRILGYSLMDHEPELAVRQKAQGSNFVRNPHAILSLAAMSKHFKAHVESFCRREMTRNRPAYRLFKTNAEIANERGLRRSPRLKAQPPVDHRCYRMELIGYLQTRCVHCKVFTEHFATMVNSVKCHARCERHFFPGVIDLTTALNRYDLRDWMLIKTRKPGPRAKKTDLPTVHYGTVRSGTPLSLGMTISYRFYEKHVYSIAKIVHGDVERHMAIKRNQRAERSDKKRRNVRRELKVQYHADLVEAFSVSEGDVEVKDHHRKRLTHYTSAAYDSDDDSEFDGEMYDDLYYGDRDFHSMMCENKANCDTCWETSMRKYHDWFF